MTGWELKAGTEAESLENSIYWHVLHGFLSLVSYMIQNHLPRGGNTHNGLGLPMSIINQENNLQTCPQAKLMEEFSLLWFPLPR